MDGVSKMERLAVLLSLSLLSFSANAGPINLEEWVFNIDGAITESYFGDSLPGDGTLNEDGLGSFSFDIEGAGNHSVIGWFDFEIDESINTFFNESGQAVGTARTNQSWEIDEPG